MVTEATPTNGARTLRLAELSAGLTVKDQRRLGQGDRGPGASSWVPGAELQVRAIIASALVLVRRSAKTADAGTAGRPIVGRER